MKSLKRLWMPVLLGVLLIATVVGVASARPSARPLEQAWRVLTVNSQSCIPQDCLTQWVHQTFIDYLNCWGASCGFVCPVYFPAAGEQAVGAVSVKRVTMYAKDGGPAKEVGFSLRKTYPPPPAKSAAAMAAGITTDLDDDPQIVVDTSIDNNPVYRVQGPYIYVYMLGADDAVLYGFYIHYTW